MTDQQAGNWPPTAGDIRQAISAREDRQAGYTEPAIRYFVATGLAGYGPDGSDGFTAVETWQQAADAIREELDSAAEFANDGADIAGEAGDFEDAWKQHKLAESLWNLAATFDNKRRNAPLYRDDPAAWDATIERLIGETFPLDISHNSRLYVWPADDESWAEHTEDDGS